MPKLRYELRNIILDCPPFRRSGDDRGGVINCMSLGELDPFLTFKTY
jgi:hypothetical protein